MVEVDKGDKLVEVDKGDMCGKESLEGRSHLERQRPCTWDLTRPRPGLTISIASGTIVLIVVEFSVEIVAEQHNCFQILFQSIYRKHNLEMDADVCQQVTI